MYDEKLFEERLSQFNPEPLITINEKIPEVIEIPAVQDDENTIDLAKANYLDVLNNEEIKRASEEIIRKYGVGTCGPRAFYGTTDVHLELEERLAKFLHLEQTIVYSYGFVAISSSIAAYCKKNDVVFVDEKANFPIEQGLVAAKSRVVKFAHNDAASLREQAAKIAKDEKKKSRKFLIVEGISWATGQLCPLPEFIAIAEEFKMRVFLEESYSLGVYGETGRGLTEYFNIDPTRVDMIFGTLEGAIGSIGGFCTGSDLTIEHQRLSGSGYIFSASLPTYLVKVVLKSLELLGDKPRNFSRLTKAFHQRLVDMGFEVQSHPEAPFKLFNCKDRQLDSRIYEYCRNHGLFFIKKDEGLMINLNVNLGEKPQRLDRIYQILQEALDNVQ